MATYTVSCVFEVITELVIEASSREEAESLAAQQFDPSEYDPEIYFAAEEA